MILEDAVGYRLSPQQRRIWRLGATGRRLRSTAVVEVGGEPDPEALRAAIEAVLRDRPSLRTRIFELPGYTEPVQVVDEDAGLGWSVVARRESEPTARRRALDRLVAESAERTFDLDRGPLLHAVLVRFPGGLDALVLEAPALNADLLSLSRVLGSLAVRLGGGEARAPAGAGDAIPHLQFCEWQNELAEEAGWAVGARRPALLPFRRPDGPGGAAPLRSVRLPLSGDFGARLERLARDTGAGLEAVLLAGFAALLARHTEDGGIEIGCLFDGRKFEELHDTVGLLARHLPIVLEPAAGTPFEEWVGEVAAALSEADDRHEFLSADGSMGSAGPGESGEHGFELLRAPGRFAAGRHTLDVVRQQASVDHFRLRLSVVLLSERWDARLDFDLAAFDRGDVESLAAQLRSLLTDAVERPAAPLLDLELVGREELERLAARGRGASLDVTGPACLHRRFEHQAARVPDAVALVSPGSEALEPSEWAHVTYRELDRRAETLALALRGLGAGPGTVVAVHLERSPDLVAAILAVLKAGAAYLPLDLVYPGARLRAMLEGSGSRWIVTRGRYAERLPGIGARVLDLDADGAAIEASGGRAPGGDGRGAYPQAAAYVLYTSGSTGPPKGVVVPHASLVNYVAWAATAYRVRDGRGVPVHTPVGFDLTVTSLLAPLADGGTAHLLPEATAVEALARDLRGGDPYSLVKLTPSHLDVLAQILGEPGPAAAPAVLVVGGEALRGESLAQWRRSAPATDVVNEYGPTEATVGCCVHRSPAGAVPDGPVPLGEPIANAEIHLAGPTLRPAPDGLAGEILIGGDVLARGYLGRPAATAERFVPHPFAEQPGARVYRSGDLARRRADGALEFLGRTDRQSKVRGFRVEPGEVESELARCPGVAEAAVVVRDDLPGGTGLVGLVVESRSGGGLGDLRAELRDRLPEALIPSSFVRVSHLPLTVHGKLNREALLELSRGGGDRRRPYLRPRSAVQLEIVRIWEELLGVRPIGISDDFFEIGGHSLLGVRMLAQVETRLGSRLPLSALLTAGTTVRRLARAVEEDGPRRGWEPLVPIQPRGSRPPLFLVHPHGGGVLCYLALSRALGTDQPVYGLQARGYAPGEEPMTRVEQIAERYVEAVREAQPQGPYALGGWSFGGVVAFEMARRLAAAGEGVDLLAVIDSDFRRQLPMDNAEFLVEQLGDGLDLDLEELRRCGDLESLLELAADRARARGLLGDDLDLDRLGRLFRLHKLTFDAASAYRPEVYGGPAMLVLSDQWLADKPADPTFGLADLVAGGLEVHVLPVPHARLVQEPWVEAVAARLGAALARRPRPSECKDPG